MPTTDVREPIMWLGELLESELAPMTLAMSEGMVARIPELGEDRALVGLLQRSVGANLSALRESLAYRIDPGVVPVPPGAVEYARRLAQRGVSVTALVRAYRVGQEMFFRWALAQFDSVGTPVSAALFGELVQIGFGYIDSISEQVIAEYDVEREQWRAHRDRARSAVLERLVAGESIDLSSAERVLGYRLGGLHLAAVLWVPGKSRSRPVHGDFEAEAQRLAGACGGGRPLLWPQDASTVWVWLPMRGEITPQIREQLAAAVPDDLDMVVAVGTVADGTEGFRVSHAEARAAEAVAVVGADPDLRLIAYGDSGVRAAALMVQDPESTRRLVQSSLGGLAAATLAAARLRETLFVLMEERDSYVAAAQRLHVHKNTVKYRVNKAIEMRGRPLNEDRLDLELALVACARLGAASLPQA